MLMPGEPAPADPGERGEVRCTDRPVPVAIAPLAIIKGGKSLTLDEYAALSAPAPVAAPAEMAKPADAPAAPAQQ